MRSSSSRSPWPLASSAASLASGARIGRFEVVRWLASGDASDVYEAEHLDLGRRVALKVVRHDDESVGATLARFRREVRAAGAMHHPNVADVLDAGVSEQGQPYVAMELLDGETLDAWLAAGPSSVAASLEIGHQLVDALAHVHSLGLVHGDVAPQNVVLHRIDRGSPTDPRMVKLVDFGLAHPLAPRGRAESTATTTFDDVGAIGAILYECVTGHPLEAGTSEPPVSVRRLRPSCPEALARVVDRAVDPRPHERFATAAALGAALSKAARELGLSRRSDAIAYSDLYPASEVSGVRPSARTLTPTPPPAWRRLGVAVAIAAGLTLATGVALHVSASRDAVGALP